MEELENLKKSRIFFKLKEKSEFEISVLLATYRIPKGKISTYKRIAELIGKPKSYRAVGNALHKNPLAPIIPCHRVVRSDGKIAGEKKSIEVRRSLLNKEGIPLDGLKVKLEKNIIY